MASAYFCSKASCKSMRRLGLLQYARGLSFQPRSAVQLFEDVERHVAASGRELFASLKDIVFWEKEHQQVLLAKEQALLAKERELLAKEKEQRARDRLDFLALKGLNDTRGLLETMQEVLANMTGVSHMKGLNLWEAVLLADPTFCLCIQNCIGIKNLGKMAARCDAIYSVLSQHVHAGKELAKLQAAKGKILFQRGDLSLEQVQILLCIGKAANFDIAEDQAC